jgi:HYDIN/CFA65/VesB-like, Ig-like domain
MYRCRTLALRVLLGSIFAILFCPGCWLATSLDQYNDVPDAGSEADAGQDVAVDGEAGADTDAEVPDGASPLSIKPESFDFGSVNVGAASPPIPFTVTNNDDSLTVGPLAIVVGLPFAPIAGDCAGKSLAPGESCSIQIVFAPLTAGTRSEVLSVRVGSEKYASASLVGVGLPAAILTVNPTVHDFGSVGVGTGSPASAFVVENSGGAVSAPLEISLAGQDADHFAITTDGCAALKLGPNDTCTFGVRFEPSTLGAKSANVVASDGPTGDVSAQITGTGVESVALTLSPTSWDFGTLEPGSVSPSTTFTLTNDGVVSSGQLAVTLDGTDAGEFAVLTDSCTGIALGPSEPCTVEMVFAPAADGAKSASLRVQDSNEEAVASLAGFAGVPVLSAAPTSISFPDTAATDSSAPVTITLTNEGPGIANDVQINVEGTDPSSFSVSSDTCSNATLGATQDCTVEVSFQPPAPGSFSAVVRAESGAHSAVVNVSGHGLEPASLTIVPTLHDFGTVGVGIASAPLTLTVTNEGEAASGPLTVDLSAQFGMTSQCNPSGILGGTSCEIAVSFAPTAAGPVAGSLTVSNGSSQAVAALLGTGTNDPILTIEPVAAQFPLTELGVSSAALHFKVTNYGAGATGLLSTVVGAPAEFIVATDGCAGSDLLSLESCSISVVFHPDTLGIHTTNLTVSATPGGTAHAALSGSGANPAELTLSPSSTDFGALPKDGSATAGVVLQNTGGSTTGVISLDISPSGPFTIVTDPCTGTTLTPSQTCSLLIEFEPTDYGIHQSILSAAETGGSTAQAALHGVTADIFVNQVTGNDAFNGHSAMFAKKTLTAGLAAAQTGWTVHVAAGTYGINETFPLSPPEASTVVVETGPVIVAPTGGNADSVFKLVNTDVVLDGFTLRPGALASPKLVDVDAVRTTLANLVLECSGTSCTGVHADKHDLFAHDLTIEFTSPSTYGTGISMGRSNSAFDTISITCMLPSGSNTQNGVSVWDYGAVTYRNLHVTSCHQGLYLSEGQVTVRDSTIEDSIEYGIVSYFTASFGGTLDLGTPAEPGNNVIRSSQGIGYMFNLWGNDPHAVPAHGNTWRADVQGADALGEYSAQTVVGPVVEVDGNNYAITTMSGTGVGSIEF